MYKKIMSLIIIIVLITFILTGCNPHPESNEKENKIEFYTDDPTLFRTDYFNCIEYKGRIAICQLTKKGDEVEELIIPEKINGKLVGYLGDPYHDPKYSPVLLGKELQKLFIDASDLKSISLDFEVSEIHVPKVIVMRDLFVFDQVRKNHKETVKLYLGAHLVAYQSLREGIVPNIGYFINKDGQENRYEDEINFFLDCYWSDDVEIGGKINTIPPVPEREGYIFDGWYTEPEYINQWDFQDGIPFAEDFIFSGDDGPDFALFGRWIEEGENL